MFTFADCRRIEKRKPMIKRSLDSHLSDLPDTSKHEIFEVLKVSEEDLMYQNPLSYTAATCLLTILNSNLHLVQTFFCSILFNECENKLHNK